MKTRFKRAFIALVTVLVGYQLYGLIAVPLLEPAVTDPRIPLTPPSLRPTRSLSGLFPPGSWELDQPKVLETDQGTLLFDDYTTFKDGRIRLTRCALILHLGSDADPASQSQGAEQAASRPIVLRAESGATVHFDGPLNPLGGEFGRVVGGRLAGQITIYSPPSTADAADGLKVVTQSVQIDEHQL